MMKSAATYEEVDKSGKLEESSLSYNYRQLKSKLNVGTQIRRTTYIFTVFNVIFSILYSIQNEYNLSIFANFSEMFLILNYSSVFANTFFLLFSTMYLMNKRFYNVNSWKYQFFILIIYIQVFSVIIEKISTNKNSKDDKVKINQCILVFSILSVVMAHIGKLIVFCSWIPFPYKMNMSSEL